MLVSGVIGNQDEGEDRDAADEIDGGQDEPFRHAAAEPPGGQRAEDVEQADHRHGPAADLRRNPAVDQIGRQVNRDEGDLKSASEEAEDQQHVRTMRESFAERVAQ